MFSPSRHGGRADRGTPVRGTFYPSDAPRGGGSIDSVVPKLLAVVAALFFVRAVIGAKRHHGASSRWSRRREAIAEFHRQLHAEDSADSGESTGRGDEAAKKA
jgi:hypothetical protein